ncbi:MAG TPA: PQQ-binding-like beta-propeller repeat protein [Acetobacteraceae bacterium]|nr:PQQ-binding-like beta-propeller repeat protein [Acetobacteraceae bacterium]
MLRLVVLLTLIALPSSAATPTDATVAFYHGAPDRAGNYVVPTLTWTAAGAVHRDQTFDGAIDGHVYAQPLYWHPSGAQGGFIIAATESNNVYAMDAAGGHVVWRTALGAPVPRDALPCGNIDPLGITGTPVIDGSTSTVYLDAMIDRAGKPEHLVFGLRLTDGSVRPGFPVDVAAGLARHGIRFNATVQNQRGAMSLLNGRIFVPFGGHNGDCGDYRGVVAAISVDPPQLVAAWATRAPKGGIWAPAGLSEADGSLYFTTGNTEDARGWQDGEGVFRVGTDLAHSTNARDYFAPSNWQQLDDYDLDLSGVTPLPLTIPKSPRRLMIALGKDGNAYLLDRSNLGGIGGAVATRRVAGSAIITSATTYPAANAALVAYRARDAACPTGRTINGIAALAVTPDAGLSTAWCSPMSGAGAPIVTTTDGTSNPIVWAVGAEGDDRLHAFRGDTGEEIHIGSGTATRMTGLRHFATILVAAGRMYIAGDNRIYAFDLP